MPARDAPFPPPSAGAARFAGAVALWLAGFGAVSAQAGDLSYFSGSFRGPGAVSENGGAQTTLECRATGETAKDGRALSQNIACESRSYKFDLRAQYVAEGVEARGFWREATRGAAGAASGRIVGQGFSGASEAKGFSGRFKIHAGPRKLIFTFWPENGKPARVHAALARKSLTRSATPAAREEPPGVEQNQGNASLKLLN
ncbi:hypothetical protein [Rhodoblastus sp.]|uniref:hypothetical protein n=1 Tax=Rhodoblastus sp. TaxID=1962975 RepID=UPI002615463F|nr:hypothetical protein [Rhodoblastus sp.]